MPKASPSTSATGSIDLDLMATGGVGSVVARNLVVSAKTGRRGQDWRRNDCTSPVHRDPDSNLIELFEPTARS